MKLPFYCVEVILELHYRQLEPDVTEKLLHKYYLHRACGYYYFYSFSGEGGGGWGGVVASLEKES